MARPDQRQPVDRHDLTLITATDALRRSDPFTITKDCALEPASVVAATSSAAQGAERGIAKPQVLLRRW